jgi:hypothetical protein
MFKKETVQNGVFSSTEFVEVQTWSAKDKVKREAIFNEVGQEYKQINLMAVAMFKMISLPKEEWSSDEDIVKAVEAFNKINEIRKS